MHSRRQRAAWDRIGRREHRAQRARAIAKRQRGPFGILTGPALLGQRFAVFDGDEIVVRDAAGTVVYAEREPDEVERFDAYARTITAHPAPLSARQRGKIQRRR